MMNWTSHMAHRQSEQLRVDAVTLSLCHQRQNFLDSQILPLNSKILILSKAMATEAQACLSGNIVSATFCQAIIALMKAQSRAAKIVERIQDSRRRFYPTQAIRATDELQKKNSLAGHLDVRILPGISSPLSDGLIRKSLSPQQIGYSALCGCAWPQELLFETSFERQNRVDIDFKPERHLIRDTSSTFRFRGAGGLSRSQSGCHLETNSMVKPPQPALPDTTTIKRDY